MRRTKASQIYKKTGNIRAVQLLLGHTKLESTVRYLGIEVDDALAISEQVELQSDASVAFPKRRSVTHSGHCLVPHESQETAEKPNFRNEDLRGRNKSRLGDAETKSAGRIDRRLETVP